ncbi:MAG: tetratricopeptide repeat protein [Actinobacteria bacterium]|nr:tetratricopeptide repeat protein [Actinomycetota bacterium]
MTATTSWVDFYDILNLPQTADAARIRDGIRVQRRLWNKRAGQADPTGKQLAERRIRELAEAERVLLDQGRRQQYDASFSSERSRAQAEQSSAGTSAGATNWLQRARDFIEAGNAHSANYAAREAIAVNGADHEAWSIRANSSFMLGDYRDAGFEFREAIRLQPQNATYHFDYGDALCANGEFSAALGEYESALRLDPGELVYKTAIANLYLLTSRPGEALNLMEDVVRQAPDNPFFSYYLAAALHDVTLSKWSKLTNGSFLITSESQIAVTRDLSNRALALKFDDDKLRASIRENLDFANQAAEVIWRHSSNVLWYVGAVLIGLFSLMSGNGGMILFGLILAGGAIAAYVARHRKPRWQFHQQSSSVARAGV